MKTLYRYSAAYAVIGILGGIFFREFTKLQQFNGITSLGVVHTHAFMLGMMFFLFLIVLEKVFQFSSDRQYKKFLLFYNSGLLLTIIMLLIRGVLQVLQSDLSSAGNAAISGIAGVAHILLTIGFILFFIILKKRLTASTLK